jgi:tRNA A-37 threonylcarbamoyl transferase component Bud32
VFLSPGTIVSGYRIEAPLGAGAMANVYRATDLGLEREVALKVLNEKSKDDRIVLTRFKREGAIHGQLKHPNIVQVYHAGQSKYGLFIAMELMAETLADQLLRGPLDPGHAIALLTPVAAALDYANGEGHIHRDVKPENILLDKAGTPYLTDFGIAKSLGLQRITRTRPGIGTPGYAAPEQVEGKSLTRRADVYSFAAVLYQCLVGVVPIPKFAGKGKLVQPGRRLPRASSQNPALPVTFDPVLRKGLARKPGRRYGSATLLVDAAREALEAAESATSPAEEAGGHVPRSRVERIRRQGLIGVLALLLLALGVGFGLLVGVPSGDSNLARAAGADIELEVPPGWHQVDRHLGVHGAGIARPIALVPESGSPDGARLVSAGISSATGQTLLPPAYRSLAGGNRDRRTAVSLGVAQAYRYAGLLTPSSEYRLAVFVAPTSIGVATVVCRLPRADPDGSAIRECEQIAGTLRLRDGKPYRLGPSRGLATVLRKRLGQLRKQRSKELKAMRQAGAASEQAAAASNLARFFHRSATSLAAVPASPESAVAKAAIVRALLSAAKAYKGLSKAAGKEDEARFTTAAAAVEREEADIGRRLGALRHLGYEVA